MAPTLSLGTHLLSRQYARQQQQQLYRVAFCMFSSPSPCVMIRNTPWQAGLATQFGQRSFGTVIRPNLFNPLRSQVFNLEVRRQLTTVLDEAQGEANTRFLPSPTVVHDVETMRKQRARSRIGSRSVGFVPTMGALHYGHVALINTAAAENDEVVVSIYVNPTQFGVNEDFNAYPKTLEKDVEKLTALNRGYKMKGYRGRITTIFAPDSKTMFPGLPPSSELTGHGSFITITPLGSKLEGESRPVFFRGVATICAKLFNIVEPDHVYFGQKDVQQAMIIRRLLTDFHFNVQMHVVATEREEDGLALSSRNALLGPRRRKIARILYEALRLGQEGYLAGKTKRADILKAVVTWIVLERQRQLGLADELKTRFKLDYVSLADMDEMNEIDEVDPAKGAILSGAILMLPIDAVKEDENLGLNRGATRTVRLIDNIILEARREQSDESDDTSSS